MPPGLDLDYFEQPQALWAHRGWAVPPQPQEQPPLPVVFAGGSETFSSLGCKDTAPLLSAAALEQTQALCAQAGWAVPPHPHEQEARSTALAMAAFEQEQPLWAQAGWAVPPHPQEHDACFEGPEDWLETAEVLAQEQPLCAQAGCAVPPHPQEQPA